MSAQVHPSAVVDANARLGANVRIGPFCVIGSDVEIGDDTIVGPHCTISGPTRIGARNHFHGHAAVGGDPQDKKFAGERTELEIGDDNVVREFVTISRGTGTGTGITRIGNGNWLLAYVHIAHDCIVGNGCVFSNNATLAGELLVLRIAADRGVAMEMIAAPDRGRAGDGAMRTDDGVVADHHVGADDRVRIDAHVRAQACARIDDGGGMHLRGHRAQPLTSAQRISAHATCSPSTRAMPWYSAMLRMVRLSSTCSSRRSPGTTMRLNFALSILTR